MRKAAFVVSCALAFGTIGAQPALCADIVGVVTDVQHQPVGGVQIVVRDAAGQSLGRAQTDAHGHYRITGLAPGAYDYVVDPLASGLKGGDAVARLGAAGLTVDWMLSSMAPAVALASEGTAAALAQVAAAGDPFGLSYPAAGTQVAQLEETLAGAGNFLGLTAGELGALVIGGTAVGVVGGYAAAGGFSGPPASPAR